MLCSMLLTPPRGNLPLRGVVESAAAVSCRAECQSERRAPSCTRAPAGAPRWRTTRRRSSACATPSTCRCSGASPHGTTKRSGSTRLEPHTMRGPLPQIDGASHHPGPLSPSQVVPGGHQGVEEVLRGAEGARRPACGQQRQPAAEGETEARPCQVRQARAPSQVTALCRRILPSTTSKGGHSSE